jgi:hypothetical protein
MTTTRFALAIATLVTAFGPRLAHATGLCENTPRHYDPPRLYAETADAFAIFGSQAWCEDDGNGKEIRGKVAFVELRDLQGAVIGILSSATGDDALRVTNLVGTFESVSGPRLAGTLKQRGYLPLTPTSPRGRCSVRTAWSPAPKERVNGFPAAKLALDVLAGSKRIARVDLGLGARDRKGAAAARAHWVPKRSGVAVWISVPSCEGPPPGYSGPDDAGECYPVDGSRLVFLDTQATPALAACFGAP